MRVVGRGGRRRLPAVLGRLLPLLSGTPAGRGTRAWPNMAWPGTESAARPLDAAVASVEQPTWRVPGGTAATASAGKSYEVRRPLRPPHEAGLGKLSNFETEPEFTYHLPGPPGKAQQPLRSPALPGPRHCGHRGRPWLRPVGTATPSASASWPSPTSNEAPITVLSVLTTNEKSHDLGVVLGYVGRPGRVEPHRLLEWTPTRTCYRTRPTSSWRTAPRWSTAPSIHCIGEQNFLYFREPSSLRVELNWQLPQLRSGLGSQHLEGVWWKLQQLLPQRQAHAHVHDRVVPAGQGFHGHRKKRTPGNEGSPPGTPMPSRDAAGDRAIHWFRFVRGPGPPRSPDCWWRGGSLASAPSVHRGHHRRLGKGSARRAGGHRRPRRRHRASL